MKKIYLLSTILLPGINAVHAQSGALDVTYGEYGTGKTWISMTSDPLNPEGGMSTSLMLPGDKLLLAGGTVNGSGFSQFAMLQVQPNGTPDSSFGINGRAFLGQAFIDNAIMGIARQQDGKIVATGYSQDSFAVVRFLANGTPDVTFGAGGIVKGRFSVTWASEGIAVAIQPDGKIVMAGVGDQTFATARFNTNGTPDNTYGNNGLAVHYFDYPPGDIFQLKAMALQPDGKIVLGGTREPLSLGDMFLARVKPNGTLDSNFGVNGTVAAAFDATTADELNALVLQPDGKIVIAGYSGDFSADGFALQRFNTDGSIDSSFGNNGKVFTILTAGATNKATAIKLQGDGKILAAGLTGFGTTMDYGLVRYKADGTLDTSLDGDGIVVTDIIGIDEANSVAIQSDGKIIVSGNVDNSNINISHVGLARYLVGPVVTGVAAPVANESELTLFPNPVVDVATLHFVLIRKQNISVKLYEASGMCINTFVDNKLMEAGNNSHVLQMPKQLPAGIYFINFSSQDETKTLRIVKH